MSFLARCCLYTGVYTYTVCQHVFQCWIFNIRCTYVEEPCYIKLFLSCHYSAAQVQLCEIYYFEHLCIETNLLECSDESVKFMYVVCRDIYVGGNVVVLVCGGHDPSGCVIFRHHISLHCWLVLMQRCEYCLTNAAILNKSF